jgi:hypothetical protein
MTLQHSKQVYLYARLKEIRNLRSEILILKNICLVGPIHIPHIKSKIDHLRNVSDFSYERFKNEITKLKSLHIELTIIKEKLLSYYD